MTAPEPKIRDLIKRLTLGTERRGVRWSIEAPNAFAVNAGRSVAFIASAAEDGGHPYRFDLRNVDGAVIARVETQEGEYYTDWESEVEQLFRAARDSALGVDDVIGAFAAELDLPELPPESDIPF